MSNALHPAAAPRRLTAFWHRERNFGDQLTRCLLGRLGVQVEYAAAATAQAIGVGSILERVPPRFAGTILGTGLMFETSRRIFPSATFLSVRGRLSADRCHLRKVPLGDLGLTVRHLFRELPPIRKSLAFVPHYVDRDHPIVRNLEIRYPDEVTVVDVTASPSVVLEQIAASANVVSSSLHGLIAAQALGKPASWALLSNNVFGNGFKFRDHFSTLSARCEPLMLADSVSLPSLLRQIHPAHLGWLERGNELFEILVEWIRQLPVKSQ